MSSASPQATVLGEPLQDGLRSALLASFALSERRAILCHRLYLGFQLQREADLQTALLSWEGGACTAWRREKMRRDCQEQIRQIELHRTELSRLLGQEVSAEAAARDWIQKHAAAWRAWWEQQPESSPVVFPHSLGGLNPTGG